MAMSHQHHQMDDGASQGDAMDMKNMDCCQNDCANCLATYQYLIPDLTLQLLPLISKTAVQIASSEPLFQSPISPFRPPISA